MTVTEGAKTATKTHLESTYLYMGLGVGGDSTNPNSTDLDSPIVCDGVLFRKAATILSSGTSSIDFKCEFDGSIFTGNTIKEVGIFDNITGGSGTMLARHNFTGVGPIAATEKVEIIITIEVE